MCKFDVYCRHNFTMITEHMNNIITRKEKGESVCIDIFKY